MLFLKQRSSFATTEDGYVLVVVLVAVAVFLLYSAETTSRAMREVRVTFQNEQSEKAFYAADAGFNRVRARALKGGEGQACGLVNCILALDGREETLAVDGVVYGAYSVSVQPGVDPGTYKIVSVGTAGTGKFAARRTISGTIESDGVLVSYEPIP